MRLKFPSVLVIATSVLALSGVVATARAQNPLSTPQWVKSYGKLPLSFEVNRDQTDPRVKFLSRGPGYTIFLTPDGAVLSLRSQESEVRRSAVRPLTFFAMKLVGANTTAAIRSLDEQAGKANYFIGSDPAKWRTNVPLYGKVKYENVYPGIDLVYYGNQQQLEYDWVVAPGADPTAIKLAVGAGLETRPSITSNGDLVIETEGGEVRFLKPVVYQESEPPSAASGNGQRTRLIQNRKFIDGRFVLQTIQNPKSKIPNYEVSFELASYDHSKPLVIDPVLVYSTLLGGTSTTNGPRASGIAVDSSGDAYITGRTNDATFPTTTGDFQTALGGGTCGTQPCEDAFVTKFNASGTALVYSTFLGGSNNDNGQSIAIDSSGEAYVTGNTFSSNFPVTASTAFQPALSTGTCAVNQGSTVCPDAFFTKLNASGTALVYSTYLGGNGPTTGTPGLAGANSGTGVAVDSSGNAYLTGVTGSTSFPVTAGAFQTTLTAGTCTFNFSGTNVTGGCPDAFVAKINPAASGVASLVYSTYLGGSGSEDLDPFQKGRPVGAIAVDSSGNAHVTGYTNSTNFPLTSGAFQATLGGGTCAAGTITGSCGDAFVTKLNSTGTALLYSTYLGGSGDDASLAIALDSSANAYVTGFTASSTNFPTTAGALQTTFGGGTDDAFVSKLNPAASGSASLVYSTYLGGNGDEATGGEQRTAAGIAVDSSGKASVTGGTNSTNFPLVSAIQSALNSGSSSTCTSNGVTRVCDDVYVSVINSGGTALTFSTYLGGPNDDDGSGIAADNSGNVYVTGTGQSGFPTTPGVFQTSSTTQAAFVAKISLTASSVSVSPTSLTFASQTVGTTSAAQTVTLTNSSTSSLTFTSIAITGTNSTSFTIMASGTTCATATPVAAGGSCLVNVTFAPAAIGTLTATLTFTDNDPSSPQTVALSGTGTAGNVTVSPGSLTFAAIAVGSTGAAQAVTVTNTGGAAVSITSIAISGDFAETNDCGASLAGNASCTVSVTFTPTTGGTRTGTLTLTDTAPNSPQTVSLTGTGNGPGVTLSAASLSFGNVRLGTTSAAQSVTLTNSGNATLNITSVAITGTNSGDFAESNTCGASVAAGASCTISVTFTPTATGARTGTLSVTDDAGGSPQSVALSGTGGQPAVDLSPASLAFGNRNLGTTSAAQSVTLTNSGNATLNITSIAASGDFAQTNNCGTSVAAGANCTISVTFTPTATGARNGAVTITDDAPGSPHTVTLSGTGQDFSLAATPTSATITAGQSATFTLSVTPQGGFNQAVSLACTGAPSLATCAVSPGSVTPDGTNPATATVTVTTTAPGMASVPSPFAGPPGTTRRAPWQLLLWAWLALLGVGAARALVTRAGKEYVGRGSTPRPVSRPAAWVLASLILCALVAASCGGGGAKPAPKPGTPAGTSTLTLTATSGNLTHSTTVSLTVN